MTSLHELQQQFAAAMWQPEGAALIGAVQGYDVADQHRRVNIYHQTVFGTLRDALAAVYPVINQLVGDKFFTHLAHAYIRAIPSQSGDLHEFGGEFPDFLAEFPAVAELVYLPDTARLEWTWHQVFHAATHAALDVARLSKVPPAEWEHLTFTLNPASRLLQSDYPIQKIWAMHQSEPAPDEQIDLAEGGVSLLVMRQDAVVVIQPLSLGEFTLLDALAAQQTFPLACAAGLTAEPALNIEHCLQQHIAQRTLVDFSYTV